MKELVLREWQQLAHDQIFKSFPATNNFMVVASVGAGKTLFACNVVNTCFNGYGFDKVVVVCNGTQMKKDWANDFRTFFGVNVDYDPNLNFAIRPGFSGACVYYSAMSNNADFIAQNWVDENTVVIIDEIHHLNEGLSYGDKAIKAFSNAGMILGLSGTPYRSDNGKIPFFNYEKKIEDGKTIYEAKADYAVSYGYCVSKKWVRPVTFNFFKGTVKWADKHGDHEELIIETLPDKKYRKVWGVALDIENGKYLLHQFQEANSKLISLREQQGKENSAGLIVCKDQDHAIRFHQHIKKLGVKCQLAISDDPDSNEVITNFRNSNDTWIIAVDKISEGVSIPRIRVIIYATTKLTPLFFTQVMGRGVRNPLHGSENYVGLADHCYMYVPALKPIFEYVEDIRKTLNHRIEELDEEQSRKKREAVERGEQGDIFYRVEDSSAEFLLARQDEHIHTKEDKERCLVIAKKYGTEWDLIASIQKDLRKLELSNSVETIVKQEVDLNQLIKEKSVKAAQLVRQYIQVYKNVYESELEYGPIQTEFNTKACYGEFKRQAEMSLQELENKILIVKDAINQLRRNEND